MNDNLLNYENDVIKHILENFSKNVILRLNYGYNNIKDIKKISEILRTEIRLLINNINIRKRKLEYLYISDEENEKEVHFKRRKRFRI